MKNRVEGRVVLSAVVLADGAVSDVKVIESLDLFYGLDDNALKAVKPD